MSIQFDEYMIGNFEIDGESYSLIEPSNFEELKSALKIRDLLQYQYSILMHDDDAQDYWLNLLQSQETNIKQYLDDVEEFNYKFLTNNIYFLAKNNNLRVGEIENLLGLSAGYISRTMKENSGKRLSIDVVWRLSKLFNISIKDLIEKDLRVPDRSIELISSFIKKLYKKTIANDIQWENQGGYCFELDDIYIKMGLLASNSNGPAIYNSDCLNQNITWELSNDLYMCRNFDKNKHLLIISINFPNKADRRIFDFLLICNEDNKDKWERIFCTADDVFSKLSDDAGELIDAIERSQLEPILSSNHRNLISKFLKEDV